jgi:hypothetical protein
MRRGDKLRSGQSRMHNRIVALFTELKRRIVKYFCPALPAVMYHYGIFLTTRYVDVYFKNTNVWLSLMCCSYA